MPCNPLLKIHNSFKYSVLKLAVAITKSRRLYLYSVTNNKANQ